MITLDLSLLNRLLVEIQSEKQFITFSDKRLNQLVLLLDPTEQYWHVHDDNIWPIKVWKTHELRIKERDAAAAAYKIKIDKKREMIDQLVAAIKSKLLLDDDMCKIVASKIINSPDPKTQGMFFGLDLSDVPQFEKPHTVIEGKNEYVF